MVQGIKLDGDFDINHILAMLCDMGIQHWSILSLDIIGDLGQGCSVPRTQKSIQHSEKGLSLSWDGLVNFANKFEQVISILIIGCNSKSSIKRYAYDQDMYKNCTITIEKIDSSHWEIFTQNEAILKRVKSSFLGSKALNSFTVSNT